MGGATREGPLPVDPPPGGGYLLYMPRVGSVCVLLRQRAPSPFPPPPLSGGDYLLYLSWVGSVRALRAGGFSDVARSDGDTSPHNATRFQNNIEKKCDVGCAMSIFCAIIFSSV